MNNSTTEQKIFRCYGCDEHKPASEFWVNRKSHKKRPVQGQCKDCCRKRGREVNYPKFKDTEKYKKQSNARKGRYNAKHPERVRARQMVRDRGLKKDACERCGTAEKLQMHHPDYSKPLEVVTLCASCHRAVHREKVAA